MKGRLRKLARRVKGRDGRDAVKATPEDPGDHGLYATVPAEARYDRERGDLLKRWFFGIRPDPRPSHLGPVEPPPEDGSRIGICCSGGGVRSAAFNLGALQVLQRRGILGRAKYLSAVSGGSYIAAAHASVATGGPDGSDPDLLDDAPPFHRGSPEEQYLRNNCSYMAPGGSGLVFLVYRVLLGLVVNLVLVAACLFVAAAVLAGIYRLTLGGLAASPRDVNYGIPDTVWVSIGLAGLGLGFGFASLLVRPKQDGWRQFCETSSIVAFALALLSFVLIVAIPELVDHLRSADGPDIEGDGAVVATATTGGGVSAIFLAVLTELRKQLTTPPGADDPEGLTKLRGVARRAITQIAAWLVVPLLLALGFVAALLIWLGELSGPWSWVALGVSALVIALGTVWADVTTWSLHPFYRRRLSTAFALRRVKRDGKGEPIAEQRSFPNAAPLPAFGVRHGEKRPTLVVCAAANVSDPGATPPGRRVTSFTFSPVAVGGPLVGGVSTANYINRLPANRRGSFSLFATVAMSGAAVSPTMGKETRTALRFLLGLANVRLGVWIPNPRRLDKWKRPEGWFLLRWLRKAKPKPKPGPRYLLKEMLGLTSVNDRYLYVTDGGHYENLGLVELLRRGCTEIYCLDASGGTSQKALGDAIALARSELGVEIEMKDMSSLQENGERVAPASCVRGTIRYWKDHDVVATGTLTYARSVVTEKAPYDVQALRLADKAFPHHSTADQRYTDQKFEAYRQLGSTVAEEAVPERAVDSGARDGARQRA